MKNLNFLLNFFKQNHIYFFALLIFIYYQPQLNGMEEQDCNFISENINIDFVYIPEHIKKAITDLAKKYPEINSIVDNSIVFSKTINILSYRSAQKIIPQIIDILEYYKEENILKTLNAYMKALESGNFKIFLNSEQNDHRGPNIFTCNYLQSRFLDLSQDALIGGDLNVSGTINGSLGATNHCVQIGNSTGGLTSITAGSDGQVLIGSTGANPAFANLTSTGGTISFTTGPSSLNIESPYSFFGNVVCVDSVFGNDSLGERNGPPFLTINAALSAALPGDSVLLFPGTYAESFTIPNGVSVVGLSTGSVKINKNVSVATDLVTMGENTRLENTTLTLTSTMHVQLRGVVFPGTTSATAKVRVSVLNVDNSTAGSGTSNVYGIHSNGAGLAGEEISAFRATTIVVTSTGLGAKRGILVDTANDFNIRDTNVIVTNYGSGSAIGVETNHASAKFTARTSTISGSTADISQTLGTMIIVTTDLLNANANSFGFSTKISPNIIVWADSGTLPAGTNFMHVGTDSPANQMFVRCSQKLLIKSLSVRARLAPSGTDTWTLFKNGVATPFTISLTNPATSNINNSQSVSFSAGDSISLQVVRGTNPGSTESVVVMELY